MQKLHRLTVVVVAGLDNANIRGKGVKEHQAAWEDRGLFVWFLPTYSVLLRHTRRISISPKFSGENSSTNGSNPATIRTNKLYRRRCEANAIKSARHSKSPSNPSKQSNQF